MYTLPTAAICHLHHYPPSPLHPRPLQALIVPRRRDARTLRPNNAQRRARIPCPTTLSISRLDTLPVPEVLEFQHRWVRIHLLLEREVVVRIRGNVLVVPGHEVGPIGVVGLEDVWIRDGAYFGEGDHLLVLAQGDEGLVLHAYGAMVAYCGIGVVAKDVDDIVAWVPGWGDGVPQPDQVAELVVLRVARVHQLV